MLGWLLTWALGLGALIGLNYLVHLADSWPKLLALGLALLWVYLYAAERARGTEAERLIDRFRLSPKQSPPSGAYMREIRNSMRPPRFPLLWKIREARDARTRAKEVINALTRRPPGQG